MGTFKLSCCTVTVLGADQLVLSRHLSVASRFNMLLDTAMLLEKGDSCANEKSHIYKAFTTAVPIFSPFLPRNSGGVNFASQAVPRIQVRSRVFPSSTQAAPMEIEPLNQTVRGRVVDGIPVGLVICQAQK